MNILYIKAFGLLIWSQFVQDNSMPKKGDWKSITQAMLPMIRMTNPFKQLGESKISDQVKIDCQLSEDLYIVKSSPDRLRTQGSVRTFKSVGNLRVNNNVIFKNSGNPDYRKIRGFGGLVVRNFASFSGTRKKSSLKADSQTMLSGVDTVKSGLNNIELQVQNFLETGTKVKGLSNLISNPHYLRASHQKIKSAGGATTSGLSKTTLGSINEEWFNIISRSINNGEYKFESTRRKPIPKPQGGERPLGIPNPRDKIIHEAIRQLLEIVFERQFMEESCGLRVNRSCHTTLNDIRLKMGSSRWFIKGDISECYDKIDHNLLVGKIEKVIEDQPFIDLIYKLLRSGYGYNKDKIYRSSIGIPQGSVISPILSNILLHDFDTAIQKLVNNFEISKRKRSNPDYTEMIRKIGVNRELNIYPGMKDDQNFKRMKYVRYADDFLVSIVGSKKDCVIIRKLISNILETDFKLNHNLDKTKIFHAVTDGAYFLGHKIRISDINKHKTKYLHKDGRKILARVVSRPMLDAPIDKIVGKLAEKGFCKKNGNPTRNGRFIHEPLQNIIRSYRELERGLLNFYGTASNYGRVSARIHYILKYSCALTFASKLKLGTLKKVFSKFGKNLTILYEDKKVLASYPTPSYKKPARRTSTKISNPFDYIEKVSKIVKRPKTAFDKESQVTN